MPVNWYGQGRVWFVVLPMALNLSSRMGKGLAQHLEKRQRTLAEAPLEPEDWFKLGLSSDLNYKQISNYNYQNSKLIDDTQNTNNKLPTTNNNS